MDSFIIIGTDICLKTLSVTCSKAIDLTSWFTTTPHPGFTDVSELLAQTDLQAKLSRVKSVLNEFQQRQERQQYCGAVQSALSDLESSVTAIVACLEEIKQLRVYHDTLWFSTWRTPDCSSRIRLLQTHANVLEKRFADLSTVVSLMYHLQIQTMFTQKKGNNNAATTPVIPKRV
jgi:hypothetical protein